MKRKFNVIDVAVLIIILLLIAVGSFVYFNMFRDKPAVNTDTAKLEFTIEVTDLSEDAANSFKVGDAVTFGESTSGSGVISSVEVLPFTKWVENFKDGEVVISEIPDRFTAKVTISSDVTKSSTAYTSGSEEVAVGRKMPFNAKGAASEESYIVDMKEVK